MKDFARSWKGSKRPSKQRKYRYKAPLHIKQKFMHGHLAKELRQKYGRRNLQLRKGDKVKVMRGEFRKKEGRVEKINLKREQVFISGLERIKKDGTKLLVPFHPSNLMIMEFNLEDRKRKQKVEEKIKVKQKGEEKIKIKEETKKRKPDKGEEKIKIKEEKIEPEQKLEQENFIKENQIIEKKN